MLLPDMSSASNDSMQNASTTPNLQDQVVSLVNTLYYLVLIPVAFVGNALSIAVVCFIARHQKTRRSIPDFCLGILAGVDLFSVLFVHSLTLGAMAKGGWLYPSWVCVYQAFAASTYLKLEFLVQITISVDRYFAVVRPLRYHRVSSIKTMRIIFAIIVLISFGTTAVSVGFDTGTVTYMVTWKFCILGVRAKTAADYAIISCTGFIFVFGFIAFIFCNFSLVRILRHYHHKKADSLIKEISQAVNTMAKEQKIPRSRHVSPTKMKNFLEVPNANNMTRVLREHTIHPPVKGARLPQSPSYSLNVEVVPEKSIDSSKLNGAAGMRNKSSRSDSLGKSIGVQLFSGSNIGKLQTNNPAIGTPTPVLGGGGDGCGEGMKYEERRGSNTARDAVGNGEITNLETPAVQMNKDEVVASRINDINPHNQDANRSPGSDSSPDSESNLLWSPKMLAMGNCRRFSKYGSDDIFGTRDGLDGGEGTWTPKTRSTVIDTDEEIFFACNTYPPTRGRSHSDSSSSIGSRKGGETLRKSVSFVESKRCLSLEDNKLRCASDNVIPYFSISPPTDIDNETMDNDNAILDVGNRIPTPAKSPEQQSEIRRESAVSFRTPLHSVSHTNIPTITVSVDDNQSEAGNRDNEGPRRPSRLTLKSSTSSMGFNAEHVAHFQQNLQKFLKKVQKKAKRQKKELLLARLVIFCSTIFVVTWVPYVVVLILSLANVTVNQVADDVALKLVFANAMMNPIFYGLCRKNYRKGYSYITQLFFHYLSCGVIDKPGDDKLFFESRRTKVKRHLQAANMEPRARRKSAHAFQMLQQTLVARSVSRSPVGTPKVSEFKPSSRLHDLFEKYMEQSDSDSDSSDSIDYDALLFAEDENMYENLKRMWSVCMYPDELWSAQDLDDDDIDLDVDYDALVAMEAPDRPRGGSCGVIQYGEGGEYRVSPDPLDSPPCRTLLEVERNPRLAMSTPNFSQALMDEAPCPASDSSKCEETKM